MRPKPRNRRARAISASAMFSLTLAFCGRANDGGPELFDATIRPLLKDFCLNCHSTEKQKGDLDLEPFSTIEEVKRHPKIWQSVAEQLANHEMPPKNKPQPSPEEKERLATWVGAVLDDLARARAGDPGPVMLRRLSNAEYTYTIHDLTGVETLQPAREFPVDGAAGEGFTNTGQALVMSPSLITKYLDAGKEIASHAVLLPDGIRFSSKATRRDWTEEIVGEIRAFYRAFSDPRGGEALSLQGVAIDRTAEGGRLPLEKHLRAAIEARDGLASGGSTDAIARERGLNAKYFATLVRALASAEPSLLLDGLRARWRGAKPGDAAALAAEIAQWQGALWKFNSIGHIGKAGGPKAWMEPVSPLAERQEVRLKLPAANAAGEVVFYLAASDAGDGNESDFVVWENARLVAPGRPELTLRDAHAVSRLLVEGAEQAASVAVPIDSADLRARAPSVLEIRIPAALASGCEFAAAGTLDAASGAEGSVQLQALATLPEPRSGLLPSATSVTAASGPWTSNNQRLSHSAPILVRDGSAARQRIESAFEAFRQLFPAALCYTKIVPVDEVVTLTLFHREDDQLARLMLDDAQKAMLDRLWTELRYVSQDALTLVDGFAQLMEFATQDADPKVFEPLRKPIHDRAAAFRSALSASEPRHVEAVLDFADRAYRRPLVEREKVELRALYQKLRAQELPHEEAIRLTLARVLVSPAFLYRAENPAPGSEQAPVDDWELASRLSYFLWSSMPDAELRAAATAHTLHDPATLLAQTRRMLGDVRARRLATEFACQWLHIHGFDTLDEKSERHFPTFGPLRGALYEESIRFFTDFFQRDGSVLGLLDSDHTFLNEALAKHYGIPGVAGEEWRRVDGVKQFSRGGILALGATLAKQSGASRTSPILRGNWVAEVLLGDRLPRPPKDVPLLPEDESADTLTVRQLTEKHTSDARCAGCHVRIDAFGFALERFDAIGRPRERDLADRPIDTRAKVMDGSEIDGLAGLRDYLLTKRRDAFLRQFCRKLLGYSLGRGVQLSDEPLLTEMQARLKAGDYRIGTAMETIVASRQFREIRGRDATVDE